MVGGVCFDRFMVVLFELVFGLLIIVLCLTVLFVGWVLVVVVIGGDFGDDCYLLGLFGFGWGG